MSVHSSLADLVGKDLQPNWVKDFPVTGQGTLIFSIQRDTKFHIVIRPKLDSCMPGADEWIALTVDKDSSTFSIYHDKKLTDKTITGTVNNELVGYEPDRKISYWFSYNRDQLVIKYGKGYCMEETTLMTYDFLENLTTDQHKAKREEMRYLFSPYTRKRIEQYDMLPLKMMIEKYTDVVKRMLERYRDVNKTSGLKGKIKSVALEWRDKAADKATLEAESENLAKSLIDIEQMVSFYKHPFTCNWSPILLDSSKVNLYELDSNAHTFSASLPPACLELYSNVTAPDLDLDWPYSIEKYKLSDAIAYSLEEGILKETLENKKGEFGSLSMTYLRVTLGKNRGSSPGIPYVLEIWPAGHGSPIHNHGNAYAVIKVLHGGLTISVFNKHADSDEAHTLQKFDVKKGDCTWISPNWFQTHQLWNTTKTYCATIQCYQYGENDFTQWPYFDYVADTDVIDEFLPDSDFTFHEMEKLVMKEYTEHMSKQDAEKNSEEANPYCSIF